MKFKGQVIDRMTGNVVKQTRWYSTWEQAHHHVDVPTWKADRYKIEVIDRWEEK